MKKFLVCAAMALMMVVCSVSDADAAVRLGGGSSIGRAAPALKQSAPVKAPSAQPRYQQQQKAAPSAAAKKPASPWRGMLMGLAATLGIAALMSALGLSEGFSQALMMILLAVLAYFALKMVMGMVLGRKMATPRQEATTAAPAQTQESASTSSYFDQAPKNAESYTAGSVMDTFSNVAADAQSLSVPAGFDTEGFEKVARENFIKLQQAWDTGNVLQISEFTTSELFIAITHQLKDRGNKQQTSEVIDLTTKLLGIVEEENEHVAVVDFSGAMKISGEFETLHERWILTQEKKSGAGWLLAGIEQAD